MDSELSFYNALASIFISEQNHPLERDGCFFHFRKDVIQMVCSTKLGFYELYFYSENDNFKIVVKCWCSLAYVPIPEVHNSVTILTRWTLRQYPTMDGFIIYFVKTWCGLPGSNGGRFKLEFWNIRDR